MNVALIVNGLNLKVEDEILDKKLNKLHREFKRRKFVKALDWVPLSKITFSLEDSAGFRPIIPLSYFYLLKIPSRKANCIN